MTDLADRIRSQLRAPLIGRRIVVLDQVSSTQEALAELAAAGAVEGTVVIADFQSAGRGRFGRPWLAPPGTALLMSVLVRPAIAPERLGQVAMAVALGTLDGLDACLRPRVPLALKWPNDLVYLGSGVALDLSLDGPPPAPPQDAQKLAGLLAELSWPAATVPELRIGLGLNVSQVPEALPPGAVSLAMLVDRVPSRADLAAAILAATDRHYRDLLAGADLLPRWTGRLSTLGQDVTAHTGVGILSGRAVAVTASGALVLRAADGTEHTVQAGDVSLSGKGPPSVPASGAVDGPGDQA